MVGAGDTNLWLQLGVAGATLLILFVTIGYVFRFVGNVQKDSTKAEDNKVDKLCDKIDNLVNVIADDRKTQAETRVANDKDQKVLIDLMGKILTTTQDTHTMVAKIDIQTGACLGGRKQEGGK